MWTNVDKSLNKVPNKFQRELLPNVGGVAGSSIEEKDGRRDGARQKAKEIEWWSISRFPAINKKDKMKRNSLRASKDGLNSEYIRLHAQEEFYIFDRKHHPYIGW
jgi:hypothetical protein